MNYRVSNTIGSSRMSKTHRKKDLPPSPRHSPVDIRRLLTGVPGLDEILGGGLPEYSFNIVAGAPGCGKTTLAHQIMFANASPLTPAIYFTVLGEPAIKMLRYQQQFSFFDVAKIDGSIKFVNLSQLVLENDLAQSSTRSLNRSSKAMRRSS